MAKRSEYVKALERISADEERYLELKEMYGISSEDESEDEVDEDWPPKRRTNRRSNRRSNRRTNGRSNRRTNGRSNRRTNRRSNRRTNEPNRNPNRSLNEHSNRGPNNNPNERPNQSPHRRSSSDNDNESVQNSVDANAGTSNGNNQNDGPTASKARSDQASETIATHFNKDDINPFDTNLIDAFLTKANFPPKEHDKIYESSEETLPEILSEGSSITIGHTQFNIDELIASGGFGSVHRGVDTSSDVEVALKYQPKHKEDVNNSFAWELYICSQIHQRIKDPNLLLGFMDISSAIIAPNGSIFVTELSQFGNLLDVTNRIGKSTGQVMDESIVMHITSQMLNLVHHLHESKIIHGDIKPDNFLLMNVPNINSDVPTIKLIDFGTSIDMSLFKPDTQFKMEVETVGINCPEMKEGRQWSYEMDKFGIAATAHVMLFSRYMEGEGEFNQYGIDGRLNEKRPIWTEFFKKFLRIEDVNGMLVEMKQRFDDELKSKTMKQQLQSQIQESPKILLPITK